MSAVNTPNFFNSFSSLVSLNLDKIDPTQFTGAIMLIGLGAFLCFILLKVLLMLFKLSLLAGSIYALAILASTGIPSANNIAVNNINNSQNNHFQSSTANLNNKDSLSSSLLSEVLNKMNMTIEDLNISDMFARTESYFEKLSSNNKKEPTHRF